MKRIIRFTEARREALAACEEYGIKASGVSQAFLRDIDDRVRKFIRQQAVASVGDGRKTVRGGLEPCVA